MKYLKVFYAAMGIALGVMVFAGGTAQATTLCTDSACTSVYPTGTTIHKVVREKVVITGSDGSVLVECRKSTIHLKTSNQSGTRIAGAISALTWGECSTTTDTIASGSLEIEKTGTNEGKVIGKGSEITISIFGVSCTYGTGTGTTLGTITGGSAPVLKILAIGLTKTAGGFLCPTPVGLDAEYVVETPHAMFIGS